MAIVPTSMEEAYRLGKAIVVSGMAPRGMDTPEKCMIAIMRGMEVGLTPMQAVDKIAVVNGRPTIWGDGAMGLVRGSGLCEWVKEEMTGAGDARVATCTVMRRGEPDPISRAFSVADAKKAQLWGKSGPWQQFPDRMLQMRARAFALRDLFADVLGGLYLREEIEDEAAPRQRRSPPPAPSEPVQQIAGPAAQAGVVDAHATEVQPSVAEQPKALSESTKALSEVVPGEASEGEKTVAPQDDEGGAQTTSEQSDEDAEIENLEAKLAHAKSVDDIEEIYNDTDAESFLAGFPGYVEKARALKQASLDRLAVKSSADPFACPNEFVSAQDFRVTCQVAIQSTTDKPTAEKLKAFWAAALAIAREAGFEESGVREMKNLVMAKLGEHLPPKTRKAAPPPPDDEPAQEQAEEPSRAISADTVPTNAAEYLAVMQARLTAADYETAKAYRVATMSEASLRESLGVAKADYEPLKAALWDLVSRLR